MSSIKQYEIPLTDDDIVDIEFEKEEGKVVAFSANLRSRIDGEWREVIRYDTAHGRLHVHRFWRAEEDQIEDLDPSGEKAGDCGSALGEAVEGIVQNWRVYRERLGG
jgi:hypothetical protein